MKVFISHSNEDAQIAKKIRNYLVHQGIDVFDDKTDISMGSNLTSSINEAISTSDAALFIISKSSEKSRWVHQEMSLAISNRLKGQEIKLIPIVTERNLEIPFFLKDYVYLDISSGHDFEHEMGRLIAGLKINQKTSIQQDLAAKITNIEIEKELLKIKSLEHEEYKKFKARQMFFIAMIATLISSVAASIGLLGWVAKIDFSDLEWAIPFFIGALSSMLGSLLYMRKEKPHKDELIRRIDELHNSLKDMEARRDK